MAARGLPAYQFGVGRLFERSLGFDQKSLAGMGERHRAFGLAGE